MHRAKAREAPPSNTPRTVPLVLTPQNTPWEGRPQHTPTAGQSTPGLPPAMETNCLVLAAAPLPAGPPLCRSSGLICPQLRDIPTIPAANCNTATLSPANGVMNKWLACTNFRSVLCCLSTIKSHLKGVFFSLLGGKVPLEENHLPGKLTDKALPC